MLIAIIKMKKPVRISVSFDHKPEVSVLTKSVRFLGCGKMALKSDATPRVTTVPVAFHQNQNN